MKDILYTVSYNKEGNLVNATEANKLDEYYCPSCKTRMILKKSGNSGKGSKRPHFAHYSLTDNCTPESALHFAFKTKLADRINESIKSNRSLEITWKCMFCDDNHSGNLIKKAKAVKVEMNLGMCQPDIALIDESGQVYSVIEVVVTHEPEVNTVSYYKANNIVLIKFNLSSENDIERFDKVIKKPDLVDICFNPKCKKCGSYKQKSTMTIIDGPCWRCKKTMKIAYVSHGNYDRIYPSKFSNKEIEFAKSKGVILEMQYSDTMKEVYLTNTCENCGTFAGEFFLFTQYISLAGYGDLPSKEYHIGYRCDSCNEQIVN